MKTETQEKQACWSPPDCSSLVKEVTRFETTDGKSYLSRGSAEMSQQDIEMANWANERLDDGWSIARILRAVGRIVPDEILEQVTKKSKLVVSHWQCRDEPGYSPLHFEPGMSIYVFGDAGSWSGSYGNTTRIVDLVRYAKKKRSILDPTTPGPAPAEPSAPPRSQS